MAHPPARIWSTQRSITCTGAASHYATALRALRCGAAASLTFSLKLPLAQVGLEASVPTSLRRLIPDALGIRILSRWFKPLIQNFVLLSQLRDPSPPPLVLQPRFS